MARKLAEYEAKRDFKKTPEPGAKVPRKETKAPRFVVQEHHARRLHWDFRLERDGVLVSWAVPKGVPPDPKKNHLAVHVEDHPLDYIGFAGDIPTGNYGAGQVSIWDSGTYETEKFSDREVMVILHGKRVQGRYVLFRTDGKNWMIHRMDPPQDPERKPAPERIEPMMARLVPKPPTPDDAGGFEFKWDGIRAEAYVEGGTVRLVSRSGEIVTARYPEVHAMGRALGSKEVILDGEIVALDDKGRPSFEEIQQRMGLSSETEIRRKMKEVPVTYMLFDVMWQAGLEGIMAKKLDSPYEPGRRSGAWVKVKNHDRQEFVIGGWLEGEGKRTGQPGAWLVGYYDRVRFVYAGKVGTGFTDAMLDKLQSAMKPLAQDKSPFDAGAPPNKADRK